MLVPGSGATGTPLGALAVVLPDMVLLELTGPVPRSAGCAEDEPLITDPPIVESPEIGALFTVLLPMLLDAVRAGIAEDGAWTPVV